LNLKKLRYSDGPVFCECGRYQERKVCCRERALLILRRAIPVLIFGPTDGSAVKPNRGTARSVLDYISYIELCARVQSLSDRLETAMAAMPAFLRGDAAARRGREVALP
jgi:hypothetical protein